MHIKAVIAIIAVISLIICAMIVVKVKLDNRSEDTIIAENTASIQEEEEDPFTEQFDDYRLIETEPEVIVSISDNNGGNGKEAIIKESKKPEMLNFVDVFGEEYVTEIIPDIPKAEFDNELYIHEGNKLTYEDDGHYSRLGVDVSHHQGSIDWEKVKAEGYDFAILRIGYRGYGESGSLNPDKTFKENIERAHEAGMDVGVYFFSQAINTDEAREEAQFVIDRLKGYSLELPVVYDPESILDDKARTDDVSGVQLTENTLAFCSMIEDAGYKHMVYSNLLWEAFRFDMTKLCDFPFWYADYELKPQTPYKYVMWQYTNEGRVDGISGVTDINIEIMEK